ncbi:MAG: hypothetical protein O2843_11450, partial [Chloroflexi bacterium]|nr:hypothetical protein [Chloroflexota bacterium]
FVVSGREPFVVSDGEPLVVSDGEPLVVSAVEPFEAVLQPQDPLVLAERAALGRRFGRSGVLAYIVIDGRFAGAAFGRWGISPFDVEDVRLDPPYDREPQRQRAIVEGLRVYFPPPTQRIRRWLGAPFEPPGEG